MRILSRERIVQHVPKSTLAWNGSRLKGTGWRLGLGGRTRR